MLGRTHTSQDEQRPWNREIPDRTHFPLHTHSVTHNVTKFMLKRGKCMKFDYMYTYFFLIRNEQDTVTATYIKHTKYECEPRTKQTLINTLYTGSSNQFYSSSTCERSQRNNGKCTIQSWQWMRSWFFIIFTIKPLTRTARSGDFDVDFGLFLAYYPDGAECEVDNKGAHHRAL